MNGLKYTKDPSRQGSGVFIALGTTRKEDYPDILPGVIVTPSETNNKGELLILYILVRHELIRDCLN